MKISLDDIKALASGLKRYAIGMDGDMERSPDGDWVHDEAANLLADFALAVVVVLEEVLEEKATMSGGCEFSEGWRRACSEIRAAIARAMETSRGG